MEQSIRRRLWLITAPLGVVVVLGVGSRAIQAHRQAAASTTQAVSHIDQQLILYPHHVPVNGIVAGGATLTGSIYPGIPYRTNTFQLTVRHHGRALPATGRITVSVSMAGMRMRPVTAELHPAGSSYSGAIRLPMFGTYRGLVTVVMPGRRLLRGSIAVTAPLPRL